MIKNFYFDFPTEGREFCNNSTHFSLFFLVSINDSLKVQKLATAEKLINCNSYAITCHCSIYHNNIFLRISKTLHAELFKVLIAKLATNLKKKCDVKIFLKFCLL